MDLKTREDKQKELWEGKRVLAKEAERDAYMEGEVVSLFASVARKLRLDSIITVL